ncbi:MAG: hypothetical protein LBS18_01860 [Clostridiales bacterium]|nr:hypothetical protein [Clostridiales bacterium]
MAGISGGWVVGDTDPKEWVQEGFGAGLDTQRGAGNTNDNHKQNAGAIKNDPTIAAGFSETFGERCTTQGVPDFEPRIENRMFPPATTLAQKGTCAIKYNLLCAACSIKKKRLLPSFTIKIFPTVWVRSNITKTIKTLAKYCTIVASCRALLCIRVKKTII